MHMAQSKTCRSKYTNTFKKIKINSMKSYFLFPVLLHKVQGLARKRSQDLNSPNGHFVITLQIIKQS